MKTRNAVRMISLCLAAVLVSVGFLIKTVKTSERYVLELKNGYSKNFDDFSAAVNNISLLLSKLKYTSTKEQAAKIAAKLLAEAELSKTALSQMPQNGELTVLNRFFSQVGNYAVAISEQISSDGTESDTIAENIIILADTAQKIAETVNTAQSNYNNSEYWAMELEEKLGSDENSLNLAESLQKLEEELTDFPTLIYDGPYSDHILEKKPALLENADDITQEEALTAAKTACDDESKKLAFSHKTQGHIPCYIFTAEGVTAAVSQKGGYNVYMRKDRAVNANILNIDQAREKAKRYLGRINMSGFKETYYYLNEGILTINFAFTDGETICYTDLIKVGVAMDNGEIVLYEAAGYISNHRDRAFVTPEYSSEQAKEVLNKALKVTGVGIALIPTAADEVRCYEFACTASDGKEILVYINVSSLKEEEILILLKSDGGTLVK